MTLGHPTPQWGKHKIALAGLHTGLSKSNIDASYQFDISKKYMSDFVRLYLKSPK